MTVVIKYSQEACLELPRASLDLYSWVCTTMNNPGAFADKETQEAKEKKSPSRYSASLSVEYRGRDHPPILPLSELHERAENFIFREISADMK